jgi:hypothetical protein
MQINYLYYFSLMHISFNIVSISVKIVSVVNVMLIVSNEIRHRIPTIMIRFCCVEGVRIPVTNRMGVKWDALPESKNEPALHVPGFRIHRFWAQLKLRVVLY